MKITKMLAKGWLGTAMLFISLSLAAQSPAQPALILIVEPAGTTAFDPIQDPSGHPFASDTGMIRLVLDVQDTANISVIHVKLGSTSGGNQLLVHDFVFDASTGLPAGTTYRREGNAVYLGLGGYSGFNAAYATVSLENGSGASSDATAFFQ